MKSYTVYPVVVAVAAWLLPQLSFAVEMETDLDDELAGATGERQEKKEAFTPKECLTVVKKVQESGQYTEESIVPVCNNVMGRSSNCEFFAEALSLASSHSDFKGKHFCDDMDRAQFCSEIMDKLLQSTAVSDLAFGECERAKPERSIQYCRRIQQMLGLSVKQEDLDTMRACYMMEAYTNTTSGAKGGLEPNENAPQSRIITGANKELDGAGRGNGTGPVTTQAPTSNIGRGDIVLAPQPLEKFGKGKGNMTAPKKIITQPEAAPAGAQQQAAPAPPPAGPILAKPIPAPEKSALQTGSSKVVAAVVAPATNMVVAQPLVAQAIMQNGTLVMTGSAFGRVVVDQRGIEEALRKQVQAAAKQAVMPKQAVAAKPPAAAKQAVVPKAAAVAPKPVATQPKPKAGLVVAEPPRVVAAAPPKPVAVVPAAHPAAAAPVTPPVAVQPKQPKQQTVAPPVAVQPKQPKQQPVAPAMPQPVFVVVMPQPAVQAAPVAPQAAPAAPAAKPATPAVQVVTAQVVAPAQPAVQAAPQATAPVAPQPKAQPVAAAQVVAQKPAAQSPPQPAQAAPAKPAATPAQPVAQAAPQKTQAPATQPKVAAPQPVASTAPKEQPVVAAKTQTAPQQAAPKAPVTKPAAVQAPAKVPEPAAKVPASPGKAVAPAAQKPAEKAPVAHKEASLRAVNKHNAELAQASQKRSKVELKEKAEKKVEKKQQKVEKKAEKKSDYSGFLSKFVAFIQED